MKHVIIYDGNNTCYRNNSVTELYTKDGRRVSGIMGTLNSIRHDIPEIEKLTKVKVTEVIFVWDFGKSKRRLEIYPEYKANRKHDNDTEDEKLWFEEFLQQAEYLHENLQYFGVKSFKKKQEEADDMAYAFKEELQNDDSECLVTCVTTDEDWLQMVSDSCYVYRPTKKLLVTPKNFVKEFGVEIENFVHYKALKGDTSDNIIGIYGVGDKIGQKLINQYKTLPNLLKNGIAEVQKSKRLKVMLEPSVKRQLFTNIRLIDFGYIDYSESVDEINEVIQSEASLQKKGVMEILKHNQLVSILMKYNSWIEVFSGLNEEL